MKLCPRYLKPFVDLVVTFFLWIYFTLGFVVFFFPAYLAAFLFAGDRRIAFQKLNHYFIRVFFRLLRLIVPGLTIETDRQIANLRSCVIVSNHRSYLDPLILIAALKKHSTIVKSTFFHIPIFQTVIKTAGYIPSRGDGKLATLLWQQIERMQTYLAEGGVLFVFPEGTRSRSGRLNPFNPGAFKIARRCRAPLEVLCITNTDKLFTPGKFLFNTCVENRIEVRRLQRISADEISRLSMEELMEAVREIMENGPSPGLDNKKPAEPSCRY